MIEVILTRDSVCMADDVKAPHEETLVVGENETIGALLQKICDMGYVAGIAGGNAAWLAVSNAPLAVFGQRWRQPKLLVATDKSLQSCGASSGKLQIDFRFKSNDDPDGLYESCRMA